MNTSSVHASPRTDASQHSLSLQDLLERLIHGVTYSRVVPITEDAAIDRFNTPCRGSALYPHHGIQGLPLPFGWTNGIPTKPSPCHDTLPPTPTNSLSLGAMSWVAPCLPKTPTATIVAKRSQTGTRYHKKQKRAHKVMSAYRARVCTPITFPRGRHR